MLSRGEGEVGRSQQMKWPARACVRGKGVVAAWRGGVRVMVVQRRG